MGTRIIDGKTIAADLRGKVTDAVHRLRRDRGVIPGIAVVLVGADSASEVYVRNKSKAVAESGMRAFDCKLAASTSEAELLALVARLNADEEVSGILVQEGRLASGLPALVPCTPMGCVILAKTIHDTLAGLEAVVAGRSNIVGKPVAQLLLAENATVT